MIDPNKISIGVNVKYGSSIVKITEIRQDIGEISFDDGTRLPVNYDKLEPIDLQPHVLNEIKKNSPIKIKDHGLLHREYIFNIDLGGKKFPLRGWSFNKNIIWQFCTISVYTLDQVQTISKMIYPDHDFKYF